MITIRDRVESQKPRQSFFSIQSLWSLFLLSLFKTSNIVAYIVHPPASVFMVASSRLLLGICPVHLSLRYFSVRIKSVLLHNNRVQSVKNGISNAKEPFSHTLHLTWVFFYLFITFEYLFCFSFCDCFSKFHIYELNFIYITKIIKQCNTPQITFKKKKRKYVN